MLLCNFMYMVNSKLDKPINEINHSIVTCGKTLTSENLLIPSCVSYLEDFSSDSALKLHNWRIGTCCYDATNKRQRLILKVRCKHVLVKIDFSHRHSSKCFVFEERKVDRISYTHNDMESTHETVPNYGLG